MGDAAALGDQQEQPEIGKIEAHLSSPAGFQPSAQAKADGVTSTLWAAGMSVKSFAMEMRDERKGDRPAWTRHT
ncbi:hypothetical protein, partial [Mesorhizobium sp. M7A.T.Ca.US.000.02.1.1]|uniref:hypothetical protein n=1 Tax=Mesorhizobium sp. M7A.T.Ca.US.000.02.1.1 TaxID=2496792 RepID=UPI0019D46125